MASGASSWMIVTVWLSGENRALARAEVAAATRRLGGRVIGARGQTSTPERSEVEVPDREAAVALANRLALAHRCAVPWQEADPELVEGQLRQLGARGESAAFQWVSGSPGARPPEILRQLGNVFRSGGGRISLDHPDLRFWLENAADGYIRVFEEVGRVDRTAFTARRTPHLPFQRPVTLAPRLARALINLSHIGPGDRVVDPFVGTGSLLLEAALIGANTVGIDANASMIRGALENFAHFGQTPEALRQTDAADAAAGFPPASFDALVTDPPYGRASGTGGEPPERLWSRALTAWTRRVRPGGHIGLVVPTGVKVPQLEARLEVAIPQRAHRSLTREFRVYVREPDSEPAQ
jgi:tRNA (guanine10-N2)-dimethyltransferase